MTQKLTDDKPASTALPPESPGPSSSTAKHPSRHTHFLHFFAWVFTGFGLFHHLGRRYKTDETVVYAVHRSFFLWGLIFYTFILLIFDVSTLKLLLWGLIFGLIFMISKYVQEVKHVAMLSAVVVYFRGLHPTMSPGFASTLSWLLLGPWITALFSSYLRGRKSFSPNGIEERYFGEGSEITDRSGLHFVVHYRDLFETIMGFGAGDIEAVDSSGKVVKRWENILGLFFVWRRLDEVLHQRAAVVDNAADDPVEVEGTRRHKQEADDANH